MDHVTITLVDLTSNDCDSEEKLQHFLDKTLTCCCTAAELLQPQETPSRLCCRCASSSPSKHQQQVCTNMRDKINRFVKHPDKYVAFVSLLLKSRAFHLACSSCSRRTTCDERKMDNELLPIVELPRTRHGKPFLSIPDSTTEISVSHQFPYIGIAQISSCQQQQKIGIDLVVFEAPNPKLYKTTRDFLLVFKNCFTDFEWNQIIQSGDEGAALKEFYTRWSIKESYTKALGMGTGIEFDAFETRFQCINDGHGLLWPNVMKESVLQGTVVWNNGAEKESTWNFFFLSLPCDDGDDVVGCACVCVGPIPTGTTTTCEIEDAVPKIECMSLDELVSWHKQGKG